MVPYRSILFVPGHKPAWIDKALAAGADCLVLDLEDSVPTQEKASARKLVRDSLALAGRGGAEVLVRVNNDRGLLADDIDAAVHYYSPGSGSPFGDRLDELRALAGGAKLSIDVLPVCAQGGGKKSALPDKVATEMLGRLELRLAQLSGHV
jgi:hypothetical protein